MLLEEDWTVAPLGVLLVFGFLTYVALELHCCSVFGATLSLQSGARLLLWNVLVLPLLCLLMLSASLVLTIMFGHMRSQVRTQISENGCYEKVPNSKLY